MRRLSIALIVLAILTACGPRGPQTRDPVSPDAVRAFYVGLAALQVGDDPRAKDELTKATQLAANEPAAWANLGILQLRQKDFDASARALEHARSLADKNTKIYETLALLERQRGNFDASQADLQKAIDLDANNTKAIYALAKEKERQVDDAAARSLYDKLLTARPENLEAQLEAMRLAAKQGDAAAVKTLGSKLLPPPAQTDAETKTQFAALGSSVAAGDTRAVLTQLSFFRNVLLRDPRFRADIAAVKYSDTTLGEPFTKPLVLQVPSSSPAAADTSLRFESQPAGDIPARWCKFVYLNGEDKPVLAAGDDEQTRVGNQVLPFAATSKDGLATIDFDYDFKNDVAIAGEKGFRLFRQVDSEFVDVTLATKLPMNVVNAKYLGVWVFDVESDGDLDLVLGAATGPPVVLQNNSDGTFVRVDALSGKNGVVQFASADLDEDGDADAIVLDSDLSLHFFSNDRGGLFRERKLPDWLPVIEGFDVGDISRNGKLELVVVLPDASVKSIEDDSGSDWKVADLFRGETAADAVPPLLCDVDNNGALDVILAGSASFHVWLADADSNYRPLDLSNSSLTSFADVDGDGRLDASTVADKHAVILLNRGARNYNWQDVRTRAAKTSGDQRINSFGIGGELEVRAGLAVQKHLITGPITHFGLGEATSADVLRVVWQNGFVQAEFDLKPNQTIAAEQRLKGSCPHLFTFDGAKFRMVKDAPPWSPALGLKINAQDTFGIIETQEWFKVPGDVLKPTAENFYEMRITGEYWETYYLDQYSLLVVDHPENTQVFTDERFSVPPAPLEVFTTGEPREFASARNDKGEDVRGIVRTLDEEYLDGFQRGPFQGVATDHFVELELPSDAPVGKRIAIVADGWVHPTDASINVQLGQSSKEKPRSLSLEVRDDECEWKVAKENLGFPAGKMKTLLIEIPNGVRAVRLRTNMEIFWDKLAWAVYENGYANQTTRLELSAGDLRYRGFSVIDKAGDSSPEKPDYDRLLTTVPRWRSMEGYYTRYGDVRELLTSVDDRYVLTNAGDEVLLKFAAMPPPVAGYKRDFVLIGNGWIKDGDLNSVFSKTLLPLPTHATNDYSRSPTTLENDPVYQKHKADWL
ncbi:MAG: FG-GAP-like repeat-containing protein, partial [Acidobacteriota bacterium]